MDSPRTGSTSLVSLRVFGPFADDAKVLEKFFANPTERNYQVASQRFQFVGGPSTRQSYKDVQVVAFSGAADRGLAQKLIDGRSVSFLWEHLDEVREERSECLHGFVALWHSDGEPGWTVGEPVVFIPSIGLDVHAYPSFMGGGEYAHLADGGVMSNVVASVVSEGLTDDSV